MAWYLIKHEIWLHGWCLVKHRDNFTLLLLSTVSIQDTNLVANCTTLNSFRPTQKILCHDVGYQDSPYDVNPVFGRWHRVEVGCITNVPEMKKLETSATLTIQPKSILPRSQLYCQPFGDGETRDFRTSTLPVSIFDIHYFMRYCFWILTLAFCACSLLHLNMNVQFTSKHSRSANITYTNTPKVCRCLYFHTFI